MTKRRNFRHDCPFLLASPVTSLFYLPDRISSIPLVRPYLARSTCLIISHSTWPIVSSLFHLPSHEYKRVWNNAGSITDPLYSKRMRIKNNKIERGERLCISLLVECSGIRRGWVMRALRSSLLLRVHRARHKFIAISKRNLE